MSHYTWSYYKVSFLSYMIWYSCRGILFHEATPLPLELASSPGEECMNHIPFVCEHEKGTNVCVTYAHVSDLTGQPTANSHHIQKKYSAWFKLFTGRVQRVQMLYMRLQSQPLSCFLGAKVFSINVN